MIFNGLSLRQVERLYHLEMLDRSEVRALCLMIQVLTKTITVMIIGGQAAIGSKFYDDIKRK